MVKIIYRRIFNVAIGLGILFLGIFLLAGPIQEALAIVALVLSISFILSSIAGILDSLQEQTKLLKILGFLVEVLTLILGIFLFVAAVFDIFVEIAVLLIILGMSIVVGFEGVMRIISGITLKLDAKWFRIVNILLGITMITLGIIFLADYIIALIILVLYVIISLFINGGIRILLGFFGTYEDF